MNKKRIAALLSFVMIATMIFGIVTALAATDLRVTVGQESTMELYVGKITTVTGYDSNLITVSSPDSNGKVKVTGRAVGSTAAKADYTAHTTGIAGSEQFNITVAAATGSNVPTTGTLSVSGVNQSTLIPYTYTEITNVISSNNAIATASISGSSVNVTGISAGKATVTFSAKASGATTTATYSYEVTVGGTNNSTATAVSIPVNGTNYITVSSFTNVSLSPSNTSNYARMEYLQTEKQIKITGVAVGTVNLSYSYTDAIGTKTVTVPVTITALASTPATETITLVLGTKPSEVRTFTTMGTPSNSNPSVASATVSGNQITITALTAGTTVVTFTHLEGTTNTTKTFNVVVNGSIPVPTETPAPTAVEPDPAAGIVFTTLTSNKVSIKKGAKKGSRIPKIEMDGESVGANKLLWISANPKVVKVNPSTGVFIGIKKGSTRVIAVDKQGKYANAVTVTVK